MANTQSIHDFKLDPKLKAITEKAAKDFCICNHLRYEPSFEYSTLFFVYGEKCSLDYPGMGKSSTHFHVSVNVYVGRNDNVYFLFFKAEHCDSPGQAFIGLNVMKNAIDKGDEDSIRMLERQITSALAIAWANEERALEKYKTSQPARQAVDQDQRRP
jgi:hypothetical protein